MAKTAHLIPPRVREKAVHQTIARTVPSKGPAKYDRKWNIVFGAANAGTTMRKATSATMAIPGHTRTFQRFMDMEYSQASRPCQGSGEFRVSDTFDVHNNPTVDTVGSPQSVCFNMSPGRR